jgi:hypothetical protein
MDSLVPILLPVLVVLAKPEAARDADEASAEAR